MRRNEERLHDSRAAVQFENMFVTSLHTYLPLGGLDATQLHPSVHSCRVKGFFGLFAGCRSSPLRARWLALSLTLNLSRSPCFLLLWGPQQAVFALFSAYNPALILRPLFSEADTVTA